MIWLYITLDLKIDSAFRKYPFASTRGIDKVDLEYVLILYI